MAATAPGGPGDGDSRGGASTLPTIPLVATPGMAGVSEAGARGMDEESKNHLLTAPAGEAASASGLDLSQATHEELVAEIRRLEALVGNNAERVVELQTRLGNKTGELVKLQSQLRQREELLNDREQQQQAASQQLAKRGGGGRARGRRRSSVNAHHPVMVATTQKKGGRFGTLMLHPGSPWRQSWDVLLVLFVLYVAVMLPVRLGFDIEADGPWFVFEVFIDVVFLVDVGLNFRTGYVDSDTKLTVMDPAVIARRYLHGWFCIDLVSSVPFQMFGSSDLSSLKMLRLLKIFRIVRLIRLKAFRELEMSGAANPSLIRMVKFVCAFCMILHVVACAYWLMASSTPSDEADDWLPPEWLRDAPLTSRYPFAYHWALLVTIGNDVHPTTTAQTNFTSLMIFLGIVVYASIIGSASSLLTNIDSIAQSKKTQMDKLNHYMRYRKVHPTLQNQIRSFYEYLWACGQSLHDEDLFEQLPESLQRKLNLALKRHLIESVPLFRTCNPAGVAALVSMLQPSIAIPGDVICKQGDIGTACYFINRGQVRVYLEPSMTELAVLSEGDHFGETAVLEQFAEVTRTASCAAITFCDLQVLNKEDLHVVLAEHDDLLEELKKESDRRQLMTKNMARFNTKGGKASKFGATSLAHQDSVSQNETRSSLGRYLDKLVQ